MKINKITSIFFSPTGGTRKIINAITHNIDCAEKQYFDLTFPEDRDNFKHDPSYRQDELIILALPVYEEHMPSIVLDALNKIKGKGQAIALVAVYGNINYGLALKDMQKWAFKAGFTVVAGAAFISEHSFSNDKLPLSVGRPTIIDLYHAENFGKSLISKLDAIKDIIKYTEVKLPGRLSFLYKILPKRSVHLFVRYPKLSKRKCSKCGNCLKVCPTAAIQADTFKIDKDKCLHCFACVKACGSSARRIGLKMNPIVKNKLKRQSKKTKIPKIFI
ncbi:MAG: EFR1 family ferrodoxin [Candidatus Neomarinimicrobiota bacterium]|jgi:ferredoxin